MKQGKISTFLVKILYLNQSVHLGHLRLGGIISLLRIALRQMRNRKS